MTTPPVPSPAISPARSRSVAETFSGIYGNASKDTRWLSTTTAYADLVSGDSFRTRVLTDGGLTV